jgi:hypothetical protein
MVNTTVGGGAGGGVGGVGAGVGAGAGGGGAVGAVGGGGGGVGGGCDCNPLLIKLGRHEPNCDIRYIANDVYINAVCDCNCRSTLRTELRKLHFTVDNACEIMGMMSEETTIIKIGHKSLHNEDVWLKFCRPISVLPPKYAHLHKINELLNCKCCSEHQKRRMWFF